MRYDHISVVVMGDNSCLSGRGFESRRRILDGYYSHCFVVKIVLFYWKDQKQTKKSLGLERRWKLKSTEVTESSGRPDHRSLTVEGLHLYCITLAQNEKILLFLKMRHPRSLFHFLVFFKQTSIQFYNKLSEKMSIQYMALGFEPTTFRMWVSSHNH